MSCVFSVSGYDLDVDQFLQLTGLEPDKITRKGEQRHQHPKSPVRDWSVVAFYTGEADFDNLAGQVQEAMAFLIKYKPQLLRIRNVAGVDHINLCFGVHSADDDQFVKSYYLPPSLLRLAGELDMSVEVSVYSKGMIAGEE